MKRKNFPGRVMQRRIDAQIRAEGRPYRMPTDDERNTIIHAQSTRTKRSRA